MSEATNPTKRKLPPGWRWLRLGDVCDIQNGWAFDSALFAPTGGVPLIRIRDLKTNTTSETYKGEYDDAYLVRSESLLIGMDGEFKCYIWKGPEALLNQRVCRLLPNAGQLAPDFLFYVVNDFLSEIEARTAYTTVKHISSKQILDIELPLPPLAEQERIAATLNEQMAAVARARAAAQAQLDAAQYLPATYLRKVFCKPNQELPPGWQWVKLGDVCEINGGSTLPESRNSRGPQAVFCLKVSDLSGAFSDGRFVHGGSHSTGIETSNAILNLGAVVFPKRGGAIATNKKRILKVKACLDPNLMGVQATDPGILTSEYLFWWFQSWDLTSIQSGNTVPQLNQQDLYPLKLPLPPLSEQKAIAAMLNEQIAAAEKLQAELEAQLNEINFLPASLLRRAFEGEL